MRKLLMAAALVFAGAGSALAQTQMQFPTTPWSAFAPSKVQCGQAFGVNANSASTDTKLSIAVPTSTYRVSDVVLSNASVSLSAATGGVFTAAGGTGTTVVTDAALSTLTAAANNAAGSAFAMTIAGVTEAYDVKTLYFRIGTAQGAAATVDVRVFCQPLYGSRSAPN